MKITVKADHLEPLNLLISTYYNNETLPKELHVAPEGLMFEPSVTNGVLTRLSKIKNLAKIKNAPIAEVLGAIKLRNNITQESYSNQGSDNFIAFLKESDEVLSQPIELDFEPVKAEFIDNIVIGESKIPKWLKNNPEYLAELLSIIKGEYIYPEELKVTEPEIVE